MNVLVPGRGRPYVDGDRIDHSSPLVFTIDNVLALSECAALIARIEELGPAAAPITTSQGFVMAPEVRNNTRVMFEDERLARELFSRIVPEIPPTICNRRAVGTNERFRCYRYEPGQYFAPHFDGAFQRDPHERSELTFMIFLNDGFEGGTTRFDDIDVVPKTGLGLFFQHFQLHEGCKLRSGVKYVLRSDVMYRD